MNHHPKYFQGHLEFWYFLKLKNFDKLQEISKLEYGWNGNDAEPFSDHLITAVRELIIPPFSNEFIEQSVIVLLV